LARWTLGRETLSIFAALRWSIKASFEALMPDFLSPP
jgi:hypothetical protein